MSEPRKMMTVAEVLEIIPFSRSTLFRLERKGRFPASHWPSPNRRVWYSDEIAAWQEALPTKDRQAVSARSRHLKSVD